MKLKLKQTSYKALRLIGSKESFSYADFNFAMGRSSKLASLLLEISGLRVVTARIYFKLVSSSALEGPFLRITGPVTTLPSTHSFTDYRKSISYDLDLTHEKLDQLGLIYSELAKTFLDFDIYIYCDSMKLGLQLFKK